MLEEVALEGLHLEDFLVVVHGGVEAGPGRDFGEGAVAEDLSFFDHGGSVQDFEGWEDLGEGREGLGDVGDGDGEGVALLEGLHSGWLNCLGKRGGVACIWVYSPLKRFFMKSKA